MVDTFLALIELQVKGSLGLKKQDWIRAANDTMPAAFSKLFSGSPDTMFQDVCR